MLNCLNPKQSITREGLQQQAGLPLQTCAVSLKFCFQNVNKTQLQNDCERIFSTFDKSFQDIAADVLNVGGFLSVVTAALAVITADQGKGKVGVLWMYDGL